MYASLNQSKQNLAKFGDKGCTPECREILKECRRDRRRVERHWEDTKSLMANEIKAWKNEADQYEDKQKKWERERKELKEDVDRLRKERNACIADCEKLKNERKLLEEDNEGSQRKIDELERQHIEVRKQMNGLEHENAELKKRNTELKGKEELLEELKCNHKELKEDHSKCELTRLKLINNIKGLENKLKRDEEAKNKQRETEAAQLEPLKQRIKQLEELLLKRDEEIKKQQRVEAAVKEQLKQYNKQFEELQTKLQELQQKQCDGCAELQARVKQLEAKDCEQCSQLEEACGHWEKLVQEEQTEKAFAELVRKEKERACQEMEGELQEAREEIATLHQSVTELKKMECTSEELNNANSTIEFLNDELENVKQKYQITEVEKERLAKLVDKMEQEAKKPAKNDLELLPYKKALKTQIHELAKKKLELDAAILQARERQLLQTPKSSCQQCPLLKIELEAANHDIGVLNRDLANKNEAIGHFSAAIRLLKHQREGVDDTWNASTELETSSREERINQFVEQSAQQQQQYQQQQQQYRQQQRQQAAGSSSQSADEQSSGTVRAIKREQLTLEDFIASKRYRK